MLVTFGTLPIGSVANLAFRYVELDEVNGIASLDILHPTSLETVGSVTVDLATGDLTGSMPIPAESEVFVITQAFVPGDIVVNNDGVHVVLTMSVDNFTAFFGIGDTVGSGTANLRKVGHVDVGTLTFEE